MDGCGWLCSNERMRFDTCKFVFDQNRLEHGWMRRNTDVFGWLWQIWIRCNRLISLFSVDGNSNAVGYFRVALVIILNRFDQSIRECFGFALIESNRMRSDAVVYGRLRTEETDSNWIELISINANAFDGFVVVDAVFWRDAFDFVFLFLVCNTVKMSGSRCTAIL